MNSHKDGGRHTARRDPSRVAFRTLTGSWETCMSSHKDGGEGQLQETSLEWVFKLATDKGKGLVPGAGVQPMMSRGGHLDGE